jgi:hypothetical protein
MGEQIVTKYNRKAEVFEIMDKNFVVSCMEKYVYELRSHFTAYDAHVSGDYAVPNRASRRVAIGIWTDNYGFNFGQMNAKKKEINIEISFVATHLRDKFFYELSKLVRRNKLGITSFDGGEDTQKWGKTAEDYELSVKIRFYAGHLEQVAPFMKSRLFQLFKLLYNMSLMNMD